MRKVQKWSTYFMQLAVQVRSRSKDPNTQVGAVIVDDDHHIVGTGYNGFPPNVEDREERWRTPAKNDLVIHAEMNAIIHSTNSTQNCTIFSTLHPCLECAKLICASGITKVYFLEEKNNESEFKARKLFELNNTFYRKLDF